MDWLAPILNKQQVDKEMVGIILSPEQIMQAPPEVGRWLEQQISTTLGLYRPAPAVQTPQPHFVGCDLESARSVLSLIHGSIPVVSVFLELGREPVAISPRGLRAWQLDTMARHAHLRSTEQAVSCLQAIDAALQRMAGAADAVLTVLDGSGHCLVANVTARKILALWQGDRRATQQGGHGSPPGAGGPLYRCGSVPGALCDRDAALHNRPPRRRAHVTMVVPSHGPA
jgi:hypothetical protein